MTFAIMCTDADVLGDRGRIFLDACVKVKIIGKPENTLRYGWRKAVARLNKCYAGRFPRGGLSGSLFNMPNLMLPTEYDDKGCPNILKTYNVIDIFDALKKFDERPFVEKYPALGSSELIDKRRADIKREYEEATANPDARLKYSWLVAQRHVRDCYAGSFADDRAFLLHVNKPSPNELYSIVEIHDAVARYNEMSFVIKFLGGSRRADIKKEYKEAMSTTDKIVEYSRNEAEQRVKDCYRSFPPNVEILPIKIHEGGMSQTTQTYNIFDICKALEQFDEKKQIQKYPEDEGSPGSEELKKSIEKHNSEMKKEYWEAKCRLRRYLQDEAEKRVRDCFSDSLQGGKDIFSIEEDKSGQPNIKTYDIVDIYNATNHFHKRGGICSVVNTKCMNAVRRDYQIAVNKLGKYSQSEAERRARDFFAGTFVEDTDIFFNEEEEKCGIQKIHQLYDIFDIKKAVDHFDAKKLRDKYLDEKDPGSKQRNQLADDERKKIEEEYTKATAKVEIEHGSGFIVHDHFIITNKHVIEGAENDKTKEIRISNAAISELSCNISYTDAGRDLALLYCPELKLRQNGIYPLQLSNQTLLPGMKVFSFGYPMSHIGEAALFVSGYVSGPKKQFADPRMIVAKLCP